MIKVYQTGILPIGQFDVRDGDLQNIRGGEVLVLDNALSDDISVPDVYKNGARTQFRLARGSDTGPFFLANSDGNSNQYSTPGFERTSLFSSSAAFSRTVDASSKVSIFAAEGFYSVSADVVDGYTINTSTAPNTRLYVNNSGYLTADPSQSKAIVGFFVEYRQDVIVNNNINRPFQTAGSMPNADSVILYKTNADGYFDIGLVSQLVGEQGTLGVPSDGYYSDGYFAFTPNTTISDAVDQLNEGFANLASGSIPVAIGNPTDGTYSDGFFDFMPSTSTADAVDDINELLAAIAPAQPGDLTGQSLVLSGTTLYDAILPSGLSASWYSGGDVAGDTVASYIVDNTYLLTSPDQANRFNGGFTSDTTQLGVLTHVVNGVDGYARDVAADGTGTTGTVTVTDISLFNSIWNKINAEVSVTQTAEGRETHALSHTLAGTSDVSEFFYDPINTAPTFDVTPSLGENTPVDGYLSGIIHYATGSTFDVSYTAASGIFNRAYHSTEVSRIEAPGAPNLAVNPSVVPAFNDNFVVTNETLTLSTANVASESPNATVRLFKPNGSTISSTAAFNRPINTFAIASTATAESFVDEGQRLTALASAAPDWTSSDTLTDGYAQVYIDGSNGVVGFPRASDYPGFVAAEQIYQRHFSKVSASSGTIVFGGFPVSSIDPYGTGDTNVLLRLDDDGLWFDAGRAFGDNNGDGSGSSPANSIGCQVGSSTGSSLDFTFGTSNTANNNNRYRVQLIFRTNADTITSLVTS